MLSDLRERFFVLVSVVVVMGFVFFKLLITVFKNVSGVLKICNIFLFVLLMYVVVFVLLCIVVKYMMLWLCICG